MRLLLIASLFIRAAAFAHTAPHALPKMVFADVQLPKEDGTFANPVADGPPAEGSTAEAVKEEASTESALLKLIGGLLAIFTPVLLVIAKKLADWLDSKKDESKVALGVKIAVDLLIAFLNEARLKLEPKLKAALADGRLDEAERAELRSILIAMAMERLPQTVVDTLSKAFGPALTSWLGAQADATIDRAVLTASAGPVVGLASPQ